MEQERLTGLWTGPAKAFMKETGQSVPVRDLHVYGWGGIAPQESGIRLDDYCPTCHYSHWSELIDSGGLIDPRNWDGSDFFMIWPLPSLIFVTEKVVRVFRENRFRGGRFTKSFPMPDHRTGYSPQRLSYWMPDERAHELGDPLGIY